MSIYSNGLHAYAKNATAPFVRERLKGAALKIKHLRVYHSYWGAPALTFDSICCGLAVTIG